MIKILTSQLFFICVGLPEAASWYRLVDGSQGCGEGSIVVFRRAEDPFRHYSRVAVETHNCALVMQ